MAKSYNQKMKLLYLRKLFLERTDREHVVSMQEIIEYLEKKHVKAERKSIYDDIEALKGSGMDIRNRRERPAGYYLASRSFEREDVALLIRMIQSQEQITDRKARELEKKVWNLCSQWQRQELDLPMRVEQRVKTMSESIFLDIDRIYEAMYADHQISFRYAEWIVEKGQMKKETASYQVSPWAIQKRDGIYELLAYEQKEKVIRKFQIDKMSYMKEKEEIRQGKEDFSMI
jgi:predicted DNA-binding transcriptional regulator YafY